MTTSNQTMVSTNYDPNGRTSLTPSAYQSSQLSTPHHSSLSSAHLLQSHSTLQTLPENSFQDFPSTLFQSDVTPEIKPFSLPSLASITANLSSTNSSSEQSHVGPHRGSHSFSASAGRRFSPLGNSPECSDLVSPLDGERSGLSAGERRQSGSGISMMIATGHRPRSRSLLSGHSVTGTPTESDVPIDESGSDSGGSEKKRDNEDSDLSASAKKRSRTLTTPSQQRRLMQVLEQTRFPSTELREQLARELGMTPRRVQIWFQNRRQGMKKAFEQRAEQEASAASTAEYNRTRGYSFGAYPAPLSDAYAQQGLHTTQTPYGGQGMQLFTSGQGAPASIPFDAFGGQQLYAPRSLTRNGMPRSLPQLQVEAKPLMASHESSGTVGEFPWSESSAASSAYSVASAVEREKLFPSFTKTQSQTYDSNGLTAYTPTPSQTLTSLTRHRSQTNPDFFGMMNGLSGLPGLGQLSHDHGQAFQHGGAVTPVQRFMAPMSEGTVVKAKSWVPSYSQPAWQEDMNSLKLDPTPFSTEPQLSHSSLPGDSLYSNPNSATQTAEFYYSDGGHPTVTTASRDDQAVHAPSASSYQAGATYHVNHVIEEYESPERQQSSGGLTATQHARQRSRSLHA